MLMRSISVFAVVLGLAGSTHAQTVPFQTPAEAKAWLSNANIAVAPPSFATLIGFDGDRFAAQAQRLDLAAEAVPLEEIFLALAGELTA